MHSPELIEQVENYVKTLLEENLPKERVFHNVKHTVQVVEQCKLLESYYKLPDRDKSALLTAAWFHDTGYCKGNNNHEAEGVKIAFDFLKGWDVTPEFLSTVEKLILVTRLPSEPLTLIEEIICDADMHHLGSPEYENWSLLLKEELEHVQSTTILDSEWTRQNISFFRSHHYFTKVAKRLWESQKRKNLFWLLDQ